MSQICPDCQKPLTPFAVSCEHCGWSINDSIQGHLDISMNADEPRTGYDIHYQAAFFAIEKDDFDSAFRSISRAMADASPQQVCEAIALKGYAYLKQLNFVEAEKECTRAIKSGWLDARTLAWRAAARCGMKRYHLAFDDLAQAIECSNGDGDEYQPMLQGYLKQARDYYGELLQKNPSDAESFWQRGWVYYRALIFDKAERDFVTSLKLDKTQGWAWVGLANIRHESGQNEEAVKFATHAVQDKSRALRRAAYNCRARAWSEIDGAEACHDDLEILRDLAGDDPGEILQIAALKIELGLNAAAVSDCDEVIRISNSNAQCHLLRGTALSRIGNHRLAFKDLSQFVDAFPDHAVGLTERGKVLVALNETDRALSDFSTALKAQPKYVPAFLGRARAYMARSMADLAINAVEKAVELDPNNSEAHEVRGQLHFSGKDFLYALDDFSRAIDLARKPEEKAGSFFLRGTTSYELGQFDLARSDFETAASLRPQHAGAWVWLAAVDARREQWSSAIHFLQRAIASRPDSAKQYLTLGQPVADKAVKYFSQQLQNREDDVNLYRDRGMAYQFIGQIENAVQDFSRVISETPDDLETRVRRGQLLQKLGNHTEAIGDFTHVIHRDKIHHLVRYYRALSLHALGDYRRAMSDVLKAIELEPREAKYHLLRGEMVQRTGRTKRAVRCFDRAIALDPKDASARRLKGLALMDLNVPHLALVELNRAVEMAPDNSDSYVARGQFFLRTKQLSEAKREFDRAIVSNPQSLKAYLGRSAVLIAENNYHETVIWLTKSLHRFLEPKSLAEILMKRGRAFYQMGLSSFAVNDFTVSMNLLKSIDERNAAKARYARALAWIQSGQIESAKHDLVKLERRFPNKFISIPQILAWLENRSLPQPPEIFQPQKMEKIPKPKAVMEPVKKMHDDQEWKSKPPFDTWVLRVGDSEYGPVSKITLDRWLEQGRLTPGMKVMRSDWPRWKHIEKVYRELLDLEK